jgi:hypothetical protein
MQRYLSEFVISPNLIALLIDIDIALSLVGTLLWRPATPSTLSRLMCLHGRSGHLERSDYIGMDWTNPAGQVGGVVRDLRGVDTKNRLGMAILMARNATFVCCAIKNLEEMLFRSTPTDVFVFFPRPKNRIDAYRRCGDYALKLPNVWFLDVEEWHTDINQSLWGKENSYPEDYRLMGEWRLAVQFKFLRKLGYKYALQFDDDSRLLEPLKVNLVHVMSKGGYHWGAKKILHDVDWACKGIAELTRYFIVAEDLVPEQLYEHCNPKNISGLYTGGWDRTIMYGNFIIVSLDFWFEPLHQRFVNLVLASRGVIRFRWVDQPVLAMMWQMFSGRDKMIIIEGQYSHKGQLWCPLVLD